MKWTGVLWLSYLDWQIYRSPVMLHQTEHAPSHKVGLWAGASLQLVNPKTWMMALAVISVFAGSGDERQVRTLYLSMIFFLVALPCLGVWALLGAGSAKWIRSASAMKRFNRFMAFLLLGSAWLSLLA
jgi:threonine/homoserine/homoserine lactone efflux protein